jgi:hypothetical protein
VKVNGEALVSNGIHCLSDLEFQRTRLTDFGEGAKKDSDGNFINRFITD